MSIHQGRSKRKPSGGRYKGDEPKRIGRLGNTPAYTEIGDEQLKSRRVRGGNEETFFLKANTVNLHIPEDEEHVEAELHDVVDSPANQNYVRRNIVTKGCVVETSEGRARITSRPGQDSVLNAVKVDE